jgi:hypothetical protein
MRCSFLDPGSPFMVHTFAPGHSRTSSSSAVSSAVSTTAPTQSLQQPVPNPDSPDLFSLNMVHLELFNNLSGKEFRSYEDPMQKGVIPLTLYIKKAFEASYLMYQLLATSALHLSITTLKSRDFYREYATGLQTRALSILNESNPSLEVTPDNRVHMFLFSSTVGLHLLCDTLHYERATLDHFIDSFTHCLNVCHGVRAVVGQCWDQLHETELGPHLVLSHIPMAPTSRNGSECDDLWRLLNATEMTLSLRNAYQEAVRLLRQTFDTQSAAEGERTRLSLVITWSIVVPPDYVKALRQQNPEALVILAHYAVLLHRGRDLWLIGDGGQFLIESICERLGSSWNEWLKFPREGLRERLQA